VPQQRIAIRQAQASCDVSGQVCHQSIGGASSHLVQLVPNVQQVQPGPLHHRVRYVDQPGRNQRSEHDGIPQTAVRLLEIRLGQVR
jgi:hypothetical protein